MSFCQDLKTEFSKEKFFFRDCRRCDMYRSQWWDVGLPLLIWRVVIAILAVTVISIAVSSNAGMRCPQMCYFTIWSFIMLTLYFVVSAIISVYSMCADRLTSSREFRVAEPKEEEGFTGTTVDPPVDSRSTDMLDNNHIRNRAEGDTHLREALPWYMVIQRILYNIALPNAILVTIIYWSVLYPMLKSDNFKTNFFDVCIHGLNSVSMITEQYLSAIPTRLLHVIHPMIYAIIYGIFSGILYGETKIVLYPYVLDWSMPGVTVGSLCGILVFFLVAQFALFVIYRAQEKCCRGR